MTAMLEILQKAAAHNGLVTAFAVVGLIVLVSGEISRRLTFGRVHGSAIAIVIGLALAYWGGTQTVGMVTGAGIGASPDVMALGIATGLVKAIMVMVGTPIAARFLALKTPRSAMVFGGLAGTVSGVSAGLAATDRKLVPYGALVATFHTGLGCLMGPSILFFAVKALVG